jgi:hypothetical protein
MRAVSWLREVLLPLRKKLFAACGRARLRMEEKQLDDQRGQHRQGSDQGVVLAMLKIQSWRES